MTDWIKHTGNTCPVDPETVVEVRYGSGLVESHRANELPWWMLSKAGVTHYRIITPAKPQKPTGVLRREINEDPADWNGSFYAMSAKPPEPEMTNPPNYLDTLSEEQRRAVLLSCPPEPDFITLRLECLKLAVSHFGILDREQAADRLLHYVLNGSVDKA
jgi:hypothetical protein